MILAVSFLSVSFVVLNHVTSSLSIELDNAAELHNKASAKLLNRKCDFSLKRPKKYNTTKKLSYYLFDKISTNLAVLARLSP